MRTCAEGLAFGAAGGAHGGGVGEEGFGEARQLSAVALRAPAALLPLVTTCNTHGVRVEGVGAAREVVAVARKVRAALLPGITAFGRGRLFNADVCCLVTCGLLAPAAGA